jgi:hypothetical protein
MTTRSKDEEEALRALAAELEKQRVRATQQEPTPTEHEAIVRLWRCAKTGTGQAKRVANFLLAWWNAEENGGFDLTDLWNVDDVIAQDMVTVFSLVARVHSYPDTLGYAELIQDVLAQWKPHTQT